MAADGRWAERAVSVRPVWSPSGEPVHTLVTWRPLMAPPAALHGEYAGGRLPSTPSAEVQRCCADLFAFAEQLRIDADRLELLAPAPITDPAPLLDALAVLERLEIAMPARGGYR